jgi:signal transduction histidine kinase
MDGGTSRTNRDRIASRRQPETWIRVGLAVAAVSYAAGAVYGNLVLTSVFWVRVTETGVAAILVATFVASYRRAIAAAAIAIVTVWAELVLSVGLVGTVAPAMYAFPVLVLGTGLLLGGRAAVAIAALSAVAVPVAAWIGGTWGALAGGGAEGHRVIIAAATMLGTAVMVQVALAAHRAALAESERTEERLRHAQRLESVGLLAGGVAHDFNNLLTAVGGNAAVLAEHPDPGVRELAAEICDAQRRGVTLTRQLLAFARRDPSRPGLIDLADAVRGMRQLLGRLAGEQHPVVAECGEAVLVVADRGQLEQVVLNLVANARDATPGGGDIRVGVRTASAADARAAGSTLAAERQALLEVIDTGAGMAPETVARIFEPFFTTKPRGQGTGLGLSTVHGIVGQSGGCVAVDTAPGRGTTFRVFLPLAAGAHAAEAAPAPPAPGEAVQGGRERVLVVEDDAAVRSLVRRVLEGAGYEVAAVPSGDEALADAARDGRTRLVLTDVVLPGMSGIELAGRLAAARPQLRVLFMSGYVEPALAGDGRLDPAKDLLRKPFAAEELLSRVRSALDR